MVVFCELALVFIIVCAIAFFVLYFINKADASSYLNFPKDMPRVDDCIWQTKKMMRIVNNMMDKKNPEVFPGCKQGLNKLDFELAESYDVRNLVRLAHMAGCRIVIREVADHDIEDPMVTKEWLENFHMNLRRLIGERIDARYR